MLPAFASPDDLDVRIPGGIPTGSESRALAALEDASSVIRSVAKKTWTTDGDLDPDVPDIVVTICLKAAVRAMSNPDGNDEEREEIDGYAHEWKRSDGSPDVYLTKKEEQMIRQAAGTSQLGVQRVTRGEIPDTPTVFLDVEPEGEPVPYMASPDPY